MNNTPKQCFHCPDKWNCYDRMMKGRMTQCKPEEYKQKIINWKWFELYAETPEERKRNKNNYINICKSIWERGKKWN